MHNRTVSKDGSRHVTDEKFNTCSHLAAAIFSLLGMVLLIVSSAEASKPWHVISFSIYGSTLVALFIASTFHHGIFSTPRVEATLKSLDYFTIFLLIAGTFTPICLIPLRGSLGWSLFGVVWGIAISGIAMTAKWPRIPKRITNTIYVTMGCMQLVVIFPLYKMHIEGISYLIAGALSYSVGACIFVIEKPNPLPGRFGFHEIWHLIVVLGALMHFFFMYKAILPLD